jgi:hypothetical protein
VLFELLGEPFRAGHRHIPPSRSVMVVTDETSMM